MPNIKSAKKRVKVIATKTAQNKAVKSALKTVIKKAYYAVDTNAANKTEAVSLAMKKIDQAAAKGIMHKNTAARSKSSCKRISSSCSCILMHNTLSCCLVDFLHSKTNCLCFVGSISVNSVVSLFDNCL